MHIITRFFRDLVNLHVGKWGMHRWGKWRDRSWCKYCGKEAK